MTIRDALDAAQKQLSAAGIESARLDAELLLGHLLDVPHLQLWLRQGDQLTPAQSEKYGGFLSRRAAREPLQHITGWTSFLGLELHVNRDVLTPRPETEVLAQLAIDSLRTAPRPALALDWGTGSGCLALALARAVPELRVLALDVSADSLRVARANAIAHRLADRVQFVQGRGLAALAQLHLPPSAHPRFDAIVANPPYIPTAEIAALPPEVRDHDPRAALDGGLDGLDCFRELATQGRAWLKPEGRMFLEFGDGQATALMELFESRHWKVIAVEKDLSERQRVLIVA